ncbi:hypothetical protein Hhal_0790 [Halorhodospira halophila SL1]|uniref:Uncharacterized protein n=1 Tax=Halorhodospira halophila (strain DSM 244 / SL1) TaxID=349124 RepID=A1WV54_HALHL|nr:hypothetical protein Hhal_0790 [Halorhodospira halophila SL1]
MSQPTPDHDQDFKNLIVDYPREAIGFFAGQEAARVDENARVLPIRQEQLKERLGHHYRELDDNEHKLFRQRYPDEEAIMTGIGSPAACPRPTRISPTWRAIPATGRRSPSRRACGALFGSWAFGEHLKA